MYEQEWSIDPPARVGCRHTPWSLAFEVGNESHLQGFKSERLVLSPKKRTFVDRFEFLYLLRPEWSSCLKIKGERKCLNLAEP